MVFTPCEGSKAVDMRRHTSMSTADPYGGKGPPPIGSPAYIREHPPPPLCVVDGKMSVFIGTDNKRTFTTTSGFFSDEALRNKVRCKGSLPSKKCLPFELRKEKADSESAPAITLLNRKSGSLRSIMMDAVEGPIPANQVPMEAHISGFGKENTGFAIQPPSPETKPAEIKALKPEVVTPATATPSPVHPAAQTVQQPKQPVEAPKHPAAQAVQSVQAKVPAPGGTVASAAFNNHMSSPCSGIPAKECTCVQETDLPLLWAPSQYLVDKVEQVSLAVPEQKDRDLKKDPLHILVLGVGTGSLSMSVLNNCRVFVPGGLKVESVEPDQNVMTVSQQFFGFKGIDGVHMIEVNSCGHALQAREEFVKRNADGKYDVVVINVVNSDGTVPTECRNSTFLGQVKNVVKEHGVVLQSVHNSELSATLQDYGSVFGHKVRKDAVTDEDVRNYHIIVAGDLNLVKSGADWPCFIGFAAMLATFVAF